MVGVDETTELWRPPNVSRKFALALPLSAVLCDLLSSEL